VAARSIRVRQRARRRRSQAFSSSAAPLTQSHTGVEPTASQNVPSSAGGAPAANMPGDTTSSAHSWLVAERVGPVGDALAGLHGRVEPLSQRRDRRCARQEQSVGVALA